MSYVNREITLTRIVCMEGSLGEIDRSLEQATLKTNLVVFYV